MFGSHLVYLWFYINNGRDTQFRLSQEKHQVTSILLTSIYNKTYKIIFSAKQLAYAISPAHQIKKIPYFKIAVNVAGIIIHSKCAS